MRVVKRYRNRRLYDTQSSRTITQFDLARLIREGHQVQVVDSETGEDITVAVLARILQAETSRWDDVREAKEFLHSIITFGGEKSMSILKNTVLASIGALQVTKARAEKIIDELIKKGELDKSDRKKAIMELLDKAEKSTADLRKRFHKEADKASKRVKDATKGLNWATQEDIKKLERKVNKLSKQVKELTEQLAPKE